MEDQISASFGFLLRSYPRLLEGFLGRMEIRVPRKELKKVSIETQVTYDSGKSKIDLQISLYNEFLIFVESKLYKNEENVVSQLKKYEEILTSKSGEFANNTKLVYVNKIPVPISKVKDIRRKLKLKKNNFFYFSWEDLIKLTDIVNKKENIKLFSQYVGDSMYNKRKISEQQIKKTVEVLAIYTEPSFWELAKKNQIAVQRNSTPDAQYIAFLRTHRENNMPSAITHIAKVEFVETNVPRSVTYKGFPKLIERSKNKRQDLGDTHKHYILGKLIPLAKEIVHIRGEGTKGQVNFATTMSELLRVKSIGEIRTLRHIREED
ncbi:MAG: PD-(D/E)XK nuclease family protein [Candidatus Woesearchaeota archaeon]